MNDFLHSLRNGQADKPRPPKTRKTYDNSYPYNNTPRYHSYSNGYQNTRNPNIKRQPISPGPMGNQLPPEDPGITLLADAIENLTHHVEILIKNQEYMSTIQERTADMIERQAFAIERIVSHLRILDHDPLQASGTSPDVRYDGMQASDQAPETSPESPMESMPSRTGSPLSLFSENAGSSPQDTEIKTKRRVIRKRRKPFSEKVSEATDANGTGLLPREEIMNIIHTMRDEGATYDQIAKHLVNLGQPTFSGRGEWHAQTIHRLCGRK
jgi:hypothetical protein